MVSYEESKLCPTAWRTDVTSYGVNIASLAFGYIHNTQYSEIKTVRTLWSLSAPVLPYSFMCDIYAPVREWHTVTLLPQSQ
jgi:hypothetical protein